MLWMRFQYCVADGIAAYSWPFSCIVRGRYAKIAKVTEAKKT